MYKRQLYEHGNAQGIRLSVDIDGRPHLLAGEGNGPINAAVHALQSAGIAVQVRSYEERSMVPVSYTHLDVYKRQAPTCATATRRFSSR